MLIQECLNRDKNYKQEESKMGRKAGSKNKVKEPISVEKSYEELTEKKTKEKEVYTFKLDIPKVRNISALSGYIENFNGKTYSSAMQNAFDWAKQYDITLINYFEQEYPGGSILVGYER